MNLPQRDLSSCKLQNKWFDSYSVSSLHYLQHNEPANLSDIVVLMYFGPAHTNHSEVPNRQQQAATASDRQFRLISKLTSKSSFTYFTPTALLTVDINSVKLSFSAEVETVSTYLRWKPELMVSLGVWRMLVHPHSHSDIQSLLWWGHSDLDIFVSINYINKPTDC